MKVYKKATWRHKIRGFLMQHAVPLPLLKRLTRFSITGGSSTAVHFCTVMLLVASRLLTPIAANIIAFLIAFSVSYFGHSRWTFADFKNNSNKRTLPKFFATAVFSFTLNESLFAYLIYVENMPYRIALLIVLASVSIVTFLISRYWAFR